MCNGAHNILQIEDHDHPKDGGGTIKENNTAKHLIIPFPNFFSSTVNNIKLDLILNKKKK